MTVLAVFLTIIGLLVVLMIYVIINGWRRGWENRYRIMATGTAARGTVTRIEPRRAGAAAIGFEFQPAAGAAAVAGWQLSTRAAVQALQLQTGSGLDIRYLPGHPRRAFSDSLVRAERDAERRAASEPAAEAVAHFYVSYSNPAAGLESARDNNLKWQGPGELEISARRIKFRARKMLRWRPITHVVSVGAVVDVEQLGPVIRMRLFHRGAPSRRLQLWALNADEASEIARQLPASRTSDFAPALAEGAAFLTTLAAVTPKTRVTALLIWLNVLMFAVATVRGGGFLIPDPAAMIAIGTDYTPLTLGGQWWRLLTSVFLHFGLLHLALNMWALQLNGTVAERLYGPSRYVLIYLVAGLSGSLASLLWHPVVNGAGASGAIFGILGALIAFFVMRRKELPASVFKAQLTSTLAFVGYNLISGARGGVDNAAHLGGLIGGFLLGLLLTRPLTTARHARSWTVQWVRATMAIAVATVVFAMLLSSGRVTPRQALDASGRSVPLAGIVISTQSLQGIVLGMTAEQLLAAKGEPIRRTSAQEWLYNTVDARHDGVIAAEFGKPGTTREGKVDVIEYVGDRDSAPPELPFLKHLSATQLKQRYGEPASKVAMNGGYTYFWFRNGVIARLYDGAVDSYGIFDYRMVGND